MVGEGINPAESRGGCLCFRAGDGVMKNSVALFPHAEESPKNAANKSSHEGVKVSEGSQSKSCTACTARTFLYSFPVIPSFPSILFKNQPLKFSVHFSHFRSCERLQQ